MKYSETELRVWKCGHHRTHKPDRGWNPRRSSENLSADCLNSEMTII